MMWPGRVGAVTVLALLYAGAAAAQGPDATERKIRRLLEQSAASWNRGDPDRHLADSADSISFMTRQGPIVGKHRTAEPAGG